MLLFFVQNVAEGVTGVVAQPVKGVGIGNGVVRLLINHCFIYRMHVHTHVYCSVSVCAGVMQEGALGLLKGTGKGLVGLLVRPAGGLIDLTSGTLEFVTQ